MGSGSWREENPFPELGVCLHPGCAGNMGSEMWGRGLQPGVRLAGKVTTHGTGESSAQAWALFPGDSSSAQALQQQGWGCGAREGEQGGFRHRREGLQGSQPFRTNLTGWGGGWGAAPHLSEL
ncbi:hypothetical protein U0070_004450, partial [Myodes glareolus]